MKLTDALLAARKAMRDPRLSGDNPAFHSKFVPRDEVLDVVLPALSEAGVLLSQGVDDGSLVTSVFMGDESAVLCRYPVQPNDNPQKYMASLTYASRGSLMLAFALAGEPDDDGNTAANTQPATKPSTKQPQHAVKGSDAEIRKWITEASNHGGKENVARFAEVLGVKEGSDIDVWNAAWRAASKAKRAEAVLVAGGAERVQ